MTIVTLLKGPKGQRQWNDETQRRADQRAYALADLHGNATAERQPNGDWIVDATAYYTPRSR